MTVELKDWPLGDALERILLVKRKPATRQIGETTTFVALSDFGGSSFFQQFYYEMRGGKVFVSGVKVVNALSVQGSVQKQGNMPDWLSRW